MTLSSFDTESEHERKGKVREEGGVGMIKEDGIRRKEKGQNINMGRKKKEQETTERKEKFPKTVGLD